MNINAISGLNFGKVYAVSGTKKQIDQLIDRMEPEQEDKKIWYGKATELYKGSKGNGFCATAVREGKEVVFFLTGNDIRKARFMAQGYGSLAGISQHINKSHTIQSVDKSVGYFRKKATEDWMEDFKGRNPYININ